MTRQWRQRLGWAVIITCVLVTAWALATRRRPADVGVPGERVARVYDVGDLVDVPVFRPEELDPYWDAPKTPPTSLFVPVNRSAQPLGRGPVFGSRGRQWPPPPTNQRMDQLLALIQAGVDPLSWKMGRGSAVGVGRRLVVVQTRQNQALVAGLINDLRAYPLKQVSVEAVWARLTPAEIARVALPGGQVALMADLAVVEQTPGAIVYRGNATTVSGEWVRVRCGRGRTVVDRVVSSMGTAAAALEPGTLELLDGAAVDVRPSLAPDGSSALLDVRSEITRWDAPDEPPIEAPPPVAADSTPAQPLKLDRLNLGVQSITTSFRGPTGAAILVGGTTEHDREDNGRQLYLILRVTVMSRQ
jgi:hypothetical protein